MKNLFDFKLDFGFEEPEEDADTNAEEPEEKVE